MFWTVTPRLFEVSGTRNVVCSYFVDFIGYRTKWGLVNLFLERIPGSMTVKIVVG